MDDAEVQTTLVFLLRSEDRAAQMIKLIDAYAARSTWTRDEIIEATLYDLKRGKSYEAVVRWLANVV